MSRFALLAVVLIAIVTIGADNRYGGNINRSIESMCVCMPARAGLIMKSAIAKTQTRSAQLFTASKQ